MAKQQTLLALIIAGLLACPVSLIAQNEKGPDWDRYFAAAIRLASSVPVANSELEYFKAWTSQAYGMERAIQQKEDSSQSLSEKEIAFTRAAERQLEDFKRWWEFRNYYFAREKGMFLLNEQFDLLNERLERLGVKNLEQVVDNTFNIGSIRGKANAVRIDTNVFVTDWHVAAGGWLYDGVKVYISHPGIDDYDFLYEEVRVKEVTLASALRDIAIVEVELSETSLLRHWTNPVPIKFSETAAGAPILGVSLITTKETASSSGKAQFWASLSQAKRVESGFAHLDLPANLGGSGQGIYTIENGQLVLDGVLFLTEVNEKIRNGIVLEEWRVDQHRSLRGKASSLASLFSGLLDFLQLESYDQESDPEKFEQDFRAGKIRLKKNQEQAARKALIKYFANLLRGKCSSYAVYVPMNIARRNGALGNKFWVDFVTDAFLGRIKFEGKKLSPEKIISHLIISHSSWADRNISQQVEKNLRGKVHGRIGPNGDFVPLNGPWLQLMVQNEDAAARTKTSAGVDLSLAEGGVELTVVTEMAPLFERMKNEAPAAQKAEPAKDIKTAVDLTLANPLNYYAARLLGKIGLEQEQFDRIVDKFLGTTRESHDLDTRYLDLLLILKNEISELPPAAQQDIQERIEDINKTIEDSIRLEDLCLPNGRDLADPGSPMETERKTLPDLSERLKTVGKDFQTLSKSSKNSAQPRLTYSSDNRQ